MSDNESVSSNNSFNKFSHKRFYCEECERTFATRYSLKRHNNFFHEENEDATSDGEENESDQSMSEDESDQSTTEDKNDQSMTEDEMNTNEVTSDEDEEQEEDTVTAMFRKLLVKAFDKDYEQLKPSIDDYKSKGISEKEATKRALFESHIIKKSLIQMYIQNVFDIEEQRRDPLFKAIMKKAKEFMDDDGLDQSEAIAAAVKFRKQAIYNMINSI